MSATASLSPAPSFSRVEPMLPPAPATAEPDLAEAALAFRQARLGLLAFVGLSILTLGVYPSVWVVRRQRLLDGLGAQPMITAKLAWCVALAPWVLTVIELEPHVAKVAVWLNLLSLAVDLVFRYRVLVAINNWRARTDRPFAMTTGGWICWFVFGSLYLQWKLNQEADFLAEQVA